MRVGPHPNLKTCWIPLPILLLALAGTAAAQAPAKPVAGQPKPTQPKPGVDQPGAPPALPAAGSTYALTLPDASRRALTSAGGIELDQLRRNGLSLAVQGPGATDVVIHTLRLEKGRVVERWSPSAKVAARTGTTMIPGDLLPPPGFSYTSQPAGAAGRPRTTFRTGTASIAPAQPWVTVGNAQQAIAQGNMSLFVDSKRMASATGLVIVAVPTCSGGDSGCLSSRTQAALLMPELFCDQ